VKFIVTGGSGFIGSHISKYLVKQNHEVIVIDDLRRGSLENLQDIQNKIDFQKINILNFEDIQKIAKNIDGIFHQAGLGSVPQSFKEPEEYYNVNAVGTENILKLAKQINCKVVYASSSSVYGNQTKFPISEDAEKNPLNPYGESKLQAEKFAQQYANNGVQVIGLRYFNVFGIGQNPNYAGVIPKFIERLLDNRSPIIEGDGTQVRNFTYIDDIVRANWLAFTSSVNHAFFNIATGITTSVNDLAKIMINLADQNLKPEYVDSRPGDIKKSQADTSLAKKLIGWEPELSLEDGLKKIVPKNK
jgi:nucleoside-diphosphate-sugar epimerase